MGNKVSTCLYIDRKILENAKRLGLNVSRVSENALVEAIKRLSGPERGTVLNSPARAQALGSVVCPTTNVPV
jgi:post-segregation antitoxin (ccd killing protein)